MIEVCGDIVGTKSRFLTAATTQQHALASIYNQWQCYYKRKIATITRLVKKNNLFHLLYNYK